MSNESSCALRLARHSLNAWARHVECVESSRAKWNLSLSWHLAPLTFCRSRLLGDDFCRHNKVDVRENAFNQTKSDERREDAVQALYSGVHPHPAESHDATSPLSFSSLPILPSPPFNGGAGYHPEENVGIKYARIGEFYSILNININTFI